MRRISTPLAAVAVVSLLGAMGEAQQLPKSGKYTGKYASHLVPEVSQTFELEKGHVFALTKSHGVFFNDVAGGFLDKSEVTCAIANDVVDDVSAAIHGHCIVTDKDGDKVFSVYQGKGTAPGIIAGDNQWTGGTGKFTGIQGNNTFRVTSIWQEPSLLDRLGRRMASTVMGKLMRSLVAVAVLCLASFAYGQTSAPGRLMIVVEFEVKPENRDQFLELLKAQAQTTRAEDGCQQYDVMLPNNDPKHVLVVEKWRDEASHSAHLKGPSFARARNVSKEWVVDRNVMSGITE